VSLSVSTYGSKALEVDLNTIGIEKGHRGPNVVITCEKMELTKDKLLSFLGEPDEVTKKGETTSLEYQNHTEWSGIMIMGYAYFLPIPIPLLLPVGESGYTFYVNNVGDVIKVEKRQRHEYFSTGFFWGETNEGGSGHYSGSWFGKSPKEVNGWVGLDNDLKMSYSSEYYKKCVEGAQ